MRCDNCQAENTPEATSCAKCGAELQAAGSLDKTITFKLGEQFEEEKSLDVSQLATEGPVLVIIRGRNLGSAYPLGVGEISIGRDPKSDIFLDDITVSRKHATIITDDEGSTVMDVGSLNGTYVNKKQIDKKTLEDKDEVQIGKFKLVFLSER